MTPNVYDHGSHETLLAMASRNSNTNGSGVDVAPYIGEADVILASGPGSGGGSGTIKLQDSADNATFADVSGYAFAAVTNAGRIARLKIDTRAVKRYVRAVLTISGSWTGVIGVLMRAEKAVKT